MTRNTEDRPDVGHDSFQQLSQEGGDLEQLTQQALEGDALLMEESGMKPECSQGLTIPDSLIKKALDEAMGVIAKQGDDTFDYFIRDHDKRLGENDTKVACVVSGCVGTIIEHRSQQYLGDPRHMIIGPGGKDQMILVTELYCSNCGVSYHHLPKGV